MKSDGFASKIAAMITSRIHATNNPTWFVDHYYFVGSCACFPNRFSEVMVIMVNTLRCLESKQTC